MPRQKLLPIIPWRILLKRGYCHRRHPLNDKTMRVVRGYHVCLSCKAEAARLSYDSDKEHVRSVKRGLAKTRRIVGPKSMKYGSAMGGKTLSSEAKA